MAASSLAAAVVCTSSNYRIDNSLATSQELKLIDHMNSLVAYSTTFNTLVRELYGISVYNLRVRNGNLTFTMAFSDSSKIFFSPH